jgi:hypothetical protein
MRGNESDDQSMEEMVGAPPTDRHCVAPPPGQATFKRISMATWHVPKQKLKILIPPSFLKNSGGRIPPSRAHNVLFTRCNFSIFLAITT